MSAAAKPLTTGDVAKLCGVAPRTVSQWMRRGELDGWRLPGPNGDRRYSRAEVLRFMDSHKMPLTSDERAELEAGHGE